MSSKETMNPHGAFERNSEQSPRLAQRWRIALTASGLALGLAGCTVTPMTVTEMSAALSAQLAAASAEAAEPVALSEGFAPAVARAVETNPGYRAALAQEREAASQVGVAESVRKLQLSTDLNLGGVRELDSAGDSMIGIYGGISVSQLIYDGGESTAAINRATAEALGARAERVSQANTLALDVARAWIDAWQFDQRLQLLHSRTSEIDTMVVQMERMAANGFVDRAALDSARRQIVDVRLEETRLQADLADAQVRFSKHFRQAPGRLSQPAEIVAAAEAQVLAKVWQNAPTLEARAASLIAARHGVEEAEAAFRPRIRLQTGLRTPMDINDPTSSNLGLGIDYSLLDGQRRVHQLQVAIARRAASEDQLRQEQVTLEAELAAAVARLAGIERSMPLVAEQMRLSASEAEAARSQIATGQSTLRELVKAEIENYLACDREIAMKAERQLLLLTIAARTGALGLRIGLQ